MGQLKLFYRILVAPVQFGIYIVSKSVFRDNNSVPHISEPYNKIGFSNVLKSFNCSLHGKLSLFDNKHLMYSKTFCPFLLIVSLASQNFPEGAKTSPRYVWDSVISKVSP